MREITFGDFSALMIKRKRTVDDLVDRFRGKIEDPREFFERVISCRHKGEDCHFFKDLNPKQRLCTCGCGLPVFARKKWAKPGCRKKVQRQESVTANFAAGSI